MVWSSPREVGWLRHKPRDPLFTVFSPGISSHDQHVRLELEAECKVRIQAAVLAEPE